MISFSSANFGRRVILGFGISYSPAGPKTSGRIAYGIKAFPPLHRSFSKSTSNRFRQYVTAPQYSTTLRKKEVVTSLSFVGVASLCGITAIVSCDGSFVPESKTRRGKLDSHSIVPDKAPIGHESDDDHRAQTTKKHQKWSLLISLMSEDLILYMAAALSSILSSLASSAQAQVFGSLFDLIGGDVGSLLLPVQKLVGLFAVQAGLSLLSSIALAVATNKLGNRLREKFFESVINMDIAYFDEHKTGEITHQLTQDISSLQTSVRTCFTRGIEGFTALVSGSVYLYIESPKLATTMLGILPIMSFVANGVGYFLRGVSEKVRKATTKATGVASESISSIRTIRSFGGEERELERYREVLDEVTKQKRVMAVAAGGFYASLGLGLNLIALLVCGYGGYLVQQGELTKGGVAAVATQVQMLERALARLSMLSAQVVKAFRASEHVFDTINLVPVVNTANGGKGLKPDDGMVSGRIDFKDVYFRYPSRPEFTVLKGFNLSIKPGQVVALVGQSGSGKTTTTSLLERFYDSSSGEILIDGMNVRDIHPDRLHEIVGTVSQEPVLFATTIFENIRYGKPEATKDEVIEAARLANAHNFIDSFPEGYDTKLGERGALLSGGQKQRVAIARAILSNPKVLLLDEATSSLDNESEKLVQNALNTLMQGRTTLIIAHRLTTVEGADVICVVNNGRIIESGSHEELLKRKDGHYRALFRRQKSNES